MPPEIKARELLTLLLDDEEFNSSRGPRTIAGFDELLEKMDKLCDAITHNSARTDPDGEYEGDAGLHNQLMAAMTENIEALRAIAHTHPDPMPTEQSDETRTLLTMIAKNTMRKQRAWEFDVQRDRRTGFTEKIIARPVGE